VIGAGLDPLWADFVCDNAIQDYRLPGVTSANNLDREFHSNPSPNV